MHIRSLSASSLTGSKKSRQRALLAALALTVTCVAHADDLLQPLGGSGGGDFLAQCPANQLLTGFELRAADDVDAIRPLCGTAAGPHEVNGVVPASEWHGGTGGKPVSVTCPAYTPVVTGMFVQWEGVDTLVVNNIHLFCGAADGSQAVGAEPAAVFDAPGHASNGWWNVSFSRRDRGRQQCSAGQVAVGMHGRSGIWVDAIGLICGESHSGAGVKWIGKVDADTKRPAGWTICDSAREARARNSPAAPGLEAQCARLPGKAMAKVIPPKEGGIPMTLCDRARDARARNSPAAPRLEEQCLASGGKP